LEPGAARGGAMPANGQALGRSRQAAARALDPAFFGRCWMQHELRHNKIVYRVFRVKILAPIYHIFFLDFCVL
jgi:hypothetical protein